MVKMSEVAARAGVSQATVSFVLGGRADRLKISSETRERVFAAAREMGYQRNQLARAMITGQSRILGVLTSPDSGENIIRVLAGAVEATSSNDYLLKVIHLSHSGIDDAAITRCREWRLAGAIVVGLSDLSIQRLSQEFAAKQVPTVMIDNAPAPDWGMRIRSDDEQGMRQVVSHLVALGHHRIAFVGGLNGKLSQWRETSFRTALSEHGLSVPEHWVRHTSWGHQEIIEAGVRALFHESGDFLPTAMVCAADSIAMIAQRIARERGLRIPQDLSITGYSNAELSACADPSLTSVDQAFFDMGYVGARHLMQEAKKNSRSTQNSDAEDNADTKRKGNTLDIESDKGLFPDFLIQTRLVVRKSTASAPHP